jgi:hypothetical protein
VSSPPTTALSLQEALRTIGNGLEAHKVPRVQITIGSTGVHVEARGEYGSRTFSWADVASQSVAQQSQRRFERQRPPWLDPWAMTRWLVLLRITGLLLDAQGIRTCNIEASLGTTPESGALGVLVDGREVLDRMAVGVELRRLRLRRGSSTVVADQLGARRPWWALWQARHAHATPAGHRSREPRSPFPAPAPKIARMPGP